MKKHSFKKSGTNFYKNGAGGGSKAIYKLYKKTDVLEKDVVPYIDVLILFGEELSKSEDVLNRASASFLASDIWLKNEGRASEDLQPV